MFFVRFLSSNLSMIANHLLQASNVVLCALICAIWFLHLTSNSSCTSMRFSSYCIVCQKKEGKMNFKIYVTHFIFHELFVFTYVCTCSLRSHQVWSSYLKWFLIYHDYELNTWNFIIWPLWPFAFDLGSPKSIVYTWT